MTLNAWRHAIVIILAFLGGGITCLSDSSITLMDFIRHGAIACGPALAALRMTLEHGGEPKVNAQAAGQ